MPTIMDCRISKAYFIGVREDLLTIKSELINDKKKVGIFIDMFLEKFDNKMTYSPPEHPLWKLFRTKHTQYGELERHLKSVQYFLDKN